MEQKLFEDIWKEVEKLHILPSQAIKHIPNVLSSTTKKELIDKGPESIVTIVLEVIDEINAGSIKTIDDLIKQRLKI